MHGHEENLIVHARIDATADDEQSTHVGDKLMPWGDKV